jgi:tetratricopeptide (TPR) repeat protein
MRARSIGGLLRGLALTTIGTSVVAALAAADIDALWEYDDPARSESAFRDALANTNGDERLELLTQIARTYGLRRRFDEAHRLLDEVASQLGNAGSRPRIRYMLERGRVFNSSGAAEQARPLFVDAWQLARSAHSDGLAVDAAHMAAITYGGTDAAIDWNRKGLALARSSNDAKAQALVPAMLNNTAWDLHDMGRYAEALPVFEQALAEWTARSRPSQVRFARWSVARCLRSLGRFHEALKIQLALEHEDAEHNSVDSDVLEEIAELYESLGRVAEARAYFARAALVLSKDPDLAGKEAERIARLRSKSK